MAPRPFVVAFEGIDGCGKDTQQVMLMEWLNGRGRKTARVADPGAGSAGKAIRHILLDKEIDLTPDQQMLLYTAARISGRDVTAGFLREGFDVVLSRWVMSTFIYQGRVQKVGESIVKATHDHFVKLNPDLYVVLDISAVNARYRLEMANTKEGSPLPDKDRFESKGITFAENLRAGYKLYGEDEPNAVVVDAEQSVEDVFADVLEACTMKIEGFDELRAISV